MQILLLFHLHPKDPHINHLNLLQITKLDTQDVAVVVAEVEAATREARVLPRGAISTTIVNGIQGSKTKNPPASSVAVVATITSPETAEARYGATIAEQTAMDRARANGYRNPRTMAWSFHIPLVSPLENVWQFHLPPHTDFLRV